MKWIYKNRIPLLIGAVTGVLILTACGFTIANQRGAAPPQSNNFSATITAEDCTTLHTEVSMGTPRECLENILVTTTQGHVMDCVIVLIERSHVYRGTVGCYP